MSEKSPRPKKKKTAFPPPPKTQNTPPPKTRNFMEKMVFPAERTFFFFPGVHKIGAPISGPRIADTNFTDTKRFFLIMGRRDAPKVAISEAPCAQNAPGRSTMGPPEALLPRNPTCQKNVGNPNHHYFSKSIAIHQKTFLGRVRVKFAQNEGHEKATKKTTKKAQTLFFQEDEGHEQIEQKMLIPGQTQEDGEPAPGSVRPLHRTDVHIIEPAGTELWIDVRIHTAHVDQPIGRDLLREEHQKCRAYGQHGFDLNRLDHGMIPVVLEQHGRTAPGAQALFQRLMHHRPQTLVRQGIAAYSAAKRQASSELWAPLSCILLTAAWQSLAECQPAPTVARPPNSSTPVRLDVTDTPKEARLTWDTTPSTQSFEDTPGARPFSARPTSSKEFFFGARPHHEPVNSPGETPA